MQAQGYQQLIVILILCLCNVESQCDRYINVTPIGKTIKNFPDITNAVDSVLAKCLPDSYKDHQPSMWYNFVEVWGGYVLDRFKESYTSTVYSQCGFNFNSTYTEICDDGKCVSFEDLNEYFKTQADIEICEADINSNISMSAIGIGYYKNICNYTQNPLYIKYQCVCNNSYQLTFYSSDKKCLFRASLSAPNALFDDDGEIDCSINKCPDNDTMIYYDNTLTLFKQDYECVNQCITKSILPTTTTQSVAMSSTEAMSTTSMSTAAMSSNINISATVTTQVSSVNKIVFTVGLMMIFFIIIFWF